MTTPTGKLAWGQAGAYDAIDDRSVIAALSGFRTGLVSPITVAVGTGLNMTVRGGWLAVAGCGDSTSAVVGSRTDQTVVGLPGPASGSRVDYIWCDVQPDSGTWSLSVINATAAAGRSGLALATLTVPANATAAAQFTIAAGDSTLERRVLAHAAASETNTRTGNTWETVGVIISATALAQPGRWYRVRFIATSPMTLTGANDMRMGIGFRPPGGPESASVLQRSLTIATPNLNHPMGASVDWVYRYPAGSAPASRQYDGRIWIVGSGSFRTCAVTNQGDPLTLTVEDLGT